MRFSRFSREKPTSSRSSEHERGEGRHQQQDERGPADPVLAHQRRGDEAGEPGRSSQHRRAGQGGSEQRAPAQAPLAEIGERRPGESAGLRRRRGGLGCSGLRLFRRDRLLDDAGVGGVERARLPRLLGDAHVSSRAVSSRGLSPGSISHLAPERADIWIPATSAGMTPAANCDPSSRGPHALRMLRKSHARRSPSRNSIARSRRMCGSAGSSPEGVSSVTRGGRKRRKCTLASTRLPSTGMGTARQARRVLRQVAREHRGLRAAVEQLGAPGARPAAARRRCTAGAAGPGAPPPRASPCSAASAITFTSAPANDARAMAWSATRRRIASSRSWLVWCRWSALVAANSSRSMRRGRTADSQVLAPGPEAPEDRLHAALQIGQRAGAGVDGGERIDEHDLPVEAGEVVAEERLHHVRLVALEAARQHGPQAAALVGGGGGLRRQRKEGEQRRAGKVARQQEAAGSRRRQLAGPARGRPADSA